MSFKDKVIYQIYPKSFYDSNNDGIGDLRGIIEKIPYIASLNIDMIWFNPFFVSPQYDNGYDIADYYKIDPRFGTMADFDEMVAKLKEHHIGVMLDMVLNHTSTDHEWFQKALAGDKHYQDYYYIRDPKPDGSLPNNWDSKFGGNAWAKFGDTGKYYLHLYERRQADLNWHNPEVRQELYKVINFWREKGVHGFRFDVINVTGKDEDLQSSPAGTDPKYMYTDKPIVQKYLHEMNQASFGKDDDSVTVGEMSSTTIPNSIEYTKPGNEELSMVFTFHHLKVDYKDGEKWTKFPFDFALLKKTLNEWQVGMSDGGGWNALFWNNHDQPRAINRFGDPEHYRARSAEMLATTMHLLRGTPYIYQGEEIGMSDPDYTSLDQYVDVETTNAYKILVEQGTSPKEAFEIIHSKSRDNSRTPMQWDDSEYAGFSKVKPWLTSTNQKEVNVADSAVSQEIFDYYQKLIKLRKQYSIISEGDYKPFQLDHKQVFGYLREKEGQKLLVLNNFYGKETSVDIPADLLGKDTEVLINNDPANLIELNNEVKLSPYQSIAFLIK